MQWIKGFFSYQVTFFLLIVYACSCAIATFVENDFGTPSAKALIYEAFWFDCLHLLLALNLLGSFKGLWKRKKYASLLLHFSFLLIVSGAGITRYFGIDGGMHIREGESSNTITSREEFIKISSFQSGESISIQALFTPLLQKHINKIIQIDGINLKIQTKDYKNSKNFSTLNISISSKNFFKQFSLSPSYIDSTPKTFEIDGKIFELSWMPKETKIPFTIKLKDFILKYYIGSKSPSNYSSLLFIEDGEKSFSYIVSSNNVLDYGGYRFYQSSYDSDEQGTILSVNYDPGKNLTYIGYSMLCIGFIWIFFSTNGRFFYLRKYLKNQNFFSILFLCLVAIPTSSVHGMQKKDIQETIQKLKNNSSDYANQFGELLVQDFQGRIKPLDSMAMDLIHKMTKENSFLGLNHNQIFLGMMIYPEEFRKLKMFPIRSPKLKKILGINKNETHVAFDDLLSNEGYLLINYVQDANQKKISDRNTFDKEILSLDERINAAYYIYTASTLRIFPDSKTFIWYSPAQTLPFDLAQTKKIQDIFQNFFFGFYQGVQENKWDMFLKSLAQLKTIQNQTPSPSTPSPLKIKLEVMLNHLQIFKHLGYFYLILGLSLFFVVLTAILKNSKINLKIYACFYFLITLNTLIHTIALLVRWYIGDHAPLSNAYESMIYIAWACSMAGITFFRKSYFSLCSSSVMSGICLFVANLGFMDPQISNLVPVLKSYWLNIHVSIITASYGFLGLCFLIGIIELILFILYSPKREQIQVNLRNLHCINEMSMMLGLAMLTIGNFLGGVWANESWGRYWGWDSKETWALISIVVYAIILHIRLVPKLYSIFTFASASILAFYSILMTYFGVNYYLSGMHSYAAGDSVPVPMFVYILSGGAISLIILAKRKIRKFPQLNQKL